MLAADGRCKVLDAAADGYVRAEAAGALFVELLPDSQVQQAGSQVTALVAGSAVGQDGRSSGLTAPNGPAQQEVMRAALATAGLTAGQVGAVQLHGTGTSLGDPIEVGALAAVMVAAPRKQPLALMAGKSLIGHSEPAAGVMGLAHAHLSVALSASLPILHLHAGELLWSCCWQETSHAKPSSVLSACCGSLFAADHPPPCTFTTTAVNPYIAPALQQGKWSLPRQLGGQPLAAEGPAISGISSFAFQGTNAHVLLAAAPAGRAILRPAAGLWQRSSYWLLAPQFDLVRAVRAGGQLVVCAASLQQPSAAALLQAVTAGGSIITLGTVLELAAEAGAQLAGVSGAAADASGRLLQGVTASHTVVPAGKAARSTVLQVAVAPKTGSFEVQLDSSSCGSGSLLTVGSQAITQTSVPTSNKAHAVLVARTLEQPATGALLASVAADVFSQLQTVAVGPAAADAALQLLTSGQLAASAEAVLVSGAAPLAADAAERFAAAHDSRVLLASCGSSSAVQLVGVSSSAALPAAPAGAAAPRAVQPVAKERVEGLLYSITWEAASPAASSALGSNRAATIAAAGRSTGAPEAIAVAQVALQSASSSIVADLRGALPATAGPAAPAGAPSTAAAELHGVLKALAQEAPAMAMSVLSSSTAAVGSSSAAGWSASVAPKGANAPASGYVHGLAIDCSATFVPRLLPQSPAAMPTPAQQGSLKGSYLVTGGSGTLGCYAALWLLQQGAESVMLLSRSGAVPEAVLLQHANNANSHVVASKADAALAADVAALVAGSSTRGVLHAGGVLADATLANQTLASIRQASVGREPCSWWCSHMN